MSLRPLKIYETDKHGNPLLDNEGRPVLVGKILPGGHIENSRPKRDDELSPGDRRMQAEHAVYDREKLLRDGAAALVVEAQRAAAETLLARAASED